MSELRPRPVPATLRRRVLRAVRAESKSPPSRRPSATLGIGLALAAGLAGLLGIPRSHTRVIQASVGRAELRVSGGHGELIVEHLPALPPDRIYELWLEPPGRMPAPSTLFAVTSRGRADLGVPRDLDGIGRVLVTVEPGGGSLAPTTRPVIQVPLSYVRRS